jgi:glycosyltransferase involved in cell wall biosynthesis
MITIFTPTYNRAQLLPQLYNSLCRQTSKQFEWIIVDDGSKDNTSNLIKKWIKKNNGFKIIYVYKKNGGKHTAINIGTRIAKYNWFFIVDDDDYLKEDAIQSAISWIEDLKNKKKFAAISGTKTFSNGKTIGGSFAKKNGTYIDAKNTERKKYGLCGDKAEIYRTDILRKYPFPVFKGEKFLSECAVGDAIATDGYMIRWYDYPLMVCEYRDDGLSYKVSNENYEVNSFYGYTYTTRIKIKAYKGLERFRIVYQYIKNAHKFGYKNTKIATLLNVSIFFIFYIELLERLRIIRNSIRKKHL